MTSWGTSRPTRTRACVRRSSTCSAASSRPAPRTRSSSSSPPSSCASPAGTLPAARTPARPTGSRCATTWCCSPCTTRATPARTSTDDASNSPTSTATPGTVLKPRDQWTVLIRDAHPGYITFEQYEQNQQTLAANAAAHSHEERRAGPAREGPALLQGLVVCGKCGKRMTVSYHKRCNGEPQPDYHCSRERDRDRHPAVPGDLRRRRRCRGRNARARTAHPAGDRNRARRLGRARPARRPDPPNGRATRRARRRGSPPTLPRCGPTNRLVADQLEADWNNKLRELADAKDEYERATQAGNRPLTHEQHARIRALATDLPALWANPATPMRERKRLIRLLLTDVTLNNTGEQITAHVRLSGGQQHTLHAPRPLPRGRRTPRHPRRSA